MCGTASPRVANHIRIEVPARAHLAGNPSDGYGGAVLSVTVPTLSATVTVADSDHFSVTGPDDSWSTMTEMAETTQRLGYDGGDRLVRAALVTLDRHLPDRPARRPGGFEWSTTIPRSVGLGGSSAIVIATMRAALAWWEIEAPPAGIGLAQLALTAETDELDIAAGLADRAVQVLGGLVLTDCRGVASATAVHAGAEIPLTLLWHEDAAAPSGDYHAVLRAAVERGDAEARADLQELARLADEAARSVADGDAERLAATLEGSLDARCRLGPVPSEALEGVDELRRNGASVNFAGSGGTLTVLGPCTAPEQWASVDVTLGPADGAS